MSKLSEKCAINAATHTLPAKCNASSSGSSSNIAKSSSSSLGVQRFCSKLRHKIEDNLTTARLTNKFAKGSRHSISMSSLSGLTDATIGKYTNKTTTATTTTTTTTAKDNEDKFLNFKDAKMKKVSGMLKYKRFAAKSTQHLVEESEKHVAEVNPKALSPAVSFVGTYVDSDDEYQMPSLSLTKQSLEDEIFEELEKVAHDEKKLNTVLKTFDRILTDFHDEMEVQQLLTASKRSILLEAELSTVSNACNGKMENKNMESLNIEEKVNEPLKNDDKKQTSINVQLQSMNNEKFMENIEENKWHMSTMLSTSNVMDEKKLYKNCLPKIEKSRTTLCESNLMSNKSKCNSYTFGGNNKLSTKLNKSVFDITTTTTITTTTPTTTNTSTSIITSKIPVWKALPLSKRSKSFCYATIEETLQKLNSTSTASVNIISNHNNYNHNLRNRAVSYMTLPEQQQQQQQPQRNRTIKCKPKLVKSKTELNVKTTRQKLSTTTTTTAMRTTTTNKQAQEIRGTSKSSSGLANVRRSHTNSDELLDKCLEKGQQILRKIESMGTQGATITTTTPTSKTTSTAIANAGIIKKTKNNSSTTAATTINGTVKGKKKCNAMPKKLTVEKVNNNNNNINIKLMVDKEKPVTVISPACELKYLAEKGRQNSDALSDDSGHISNEANDNHQQTLLSESTITSTSSSSSSSSTLSSPTSSTLGSVDLEHFDVHAVAVATKTTTATSTAIATAGINNNKSMSKVFQLMQKFQTPSAPPTTTITTTAAPVNDNKILQNHIITKNPLQQQQQQQQQQQCHVVDEEEEEEKGSADEEEEGREVQLNEKTSNGACTSIKVAKVEPIHCIKTHIEIFPNYSKEVTTWFY